MVYNLDFMIKIESFLIGLTLIIIGFIKLC